MLTTYSPEELKASGWEITTNHGQSYKYIYAYQTAMYEALMKRINSNSQGYLEDAFKDLAKKHTIYGKSPTMVIIDDLHDLHNKESEP